MTITVITPFNVGSIDPHHTYSLTDLAIATGKSRKYLTRHIRDGNLKGWQPTGAKEYWVWGQDFVDWFLGKGK